MKRILIDNNLSLVVKNFNDNLFADKRKSFIKPLDHLINLKKHLSDLNQIKYIEKVISEYDELLDLKPSQFDTKIREFENIYVIDEKINVGSKEFGKKIVQALRYEDYRKSQYPKIVNNLRWNLKTCFYCNYSGTLTIERGKNYKTFYDLDHVLPKSIYPFLATSFFNFIPACSTCNRTKTNILVTGLNPFYEIGETNYKLEKIFHVPKKSRIKFYNSNNKEEIEILVADTINNLKKSDLDKIVDLKLLYNSQKHIVEEILWKKRIYSSSYINKIRISFKKLQLSDSKINRILWGTDLNEHKINDLPLSKLKFDLINEK